MPEKRNYQQENYRRHWKSEGTLSDIVISQTLKHVQDMSNFNKTSNPHGYLALFASKTPLVIWYFIIDLIPSNSYSYLALFESKSTVIFICFHHLIIFFKLCKITQTLHRVFSFQYKLLFSVLLLKYLLRDLFLLLLLLYVFKTSDYFVIASLIID